MLAPRTRSVLARIAGARVALERTHPTTLTKFSTLAPLRQPTTTTTTPEDTPGSRLPLALQSIYYAPFRRTPTHGLPVCDLQLRAFSVRNLEFMCDFALRAAYYLHLPASGPVPLPKRTERWTVPRGHFVHKKSQENYERVTHKRLIQIKDGHPETVELWLAFLRKHQYHGVGMKANVWGFEELGVGKRMNVSLETLKDVPRPKWVHFGNRRNFETAEKVREILNSEGYKALSAEPAAVDAAVQKVTEDEAVQKKIKAILESPSYRALVAEDRGGEGKGGVQKVKPDEVMTEEEGEGEGQAKAVEEEKEEALRASGMEDVVAETAAAPEKQAEPAPPAETAPEDHILTQAVPAAAAAPEDHILTQAVPAAAAAETPTETQPEDPAPTTSAPVEAPAPEPAVETQPEDSVLAKAPPEPASSPADEPTPSVLTPPSEAIPAATTTDADADTPPRTEAQSKPAEEPAPAPVQAAAEGEVLSEESVEVKPEDEVLPSTAPAEETDAHAQTEVLSEESVEVKPEDEVLSNTAPAEETDAHAQTQPPVAAEDQVLSKPEEEEAAAAEVEALAKEPEAALEDVKVEPLDEAAEAAAVAPETGAKEEVEVEESKEKKE